jgi:hypothetical protein
MPEPRPNAKPAQRSPNVQLQQRPNTLSQQPRMLLRPAQRPAPRDRYSLQLR